MPAPTVLARCRRASSTAGASSATFIKARSTSGTAKAFGHRAKSRGKITRPTARRGGVGEIRIGFPLGRVKRFVERLRDPRLALVPFTSDDDRMHDRKNGGAAEVLAFDRREVLEQPLHRAAARSKAGRHARGVEGV